MNSHKIALLEGFVPLVKVGDAVVVDQPVAEKPIKKEQTINIVEQLKVPLNKVKNVLKKNPGDSVSKGDVIASKKGLFGMDKAEIISNIDGIVFRYERGTGNLVIRIASEASYAAASEKIKSPVAGTISLCDNGQIVIDLEAEEERIEDIQETEGTKGTEGTPLRQGFQPRQDFAGRVAGQAGGEEEPGLKMGIGGEGSGELFVLDESFSSEGLDKVLYDLNSDMTGKVVLGGALTREIIMKGIGIGVAGFVGANVSKEDLDFFAEKKTEIPIIQTDASTVEKLRYWQNKQVKVNGEERLVSLVL